MIFSVTFKNLDNENVTIKASTVKPSDEAYDKNVDNAESYEVVARPDALIIHYAERTVSNPKVGEVSVAYDKIVSLVIGSTTFTKFSYDEVTKALETAFMKKA